MLRNGVEWGLKGGVFEKTLRVNGSKFQYQSLFCGLTPVAKIGHEFAALKHTSKKTTGYLRTDKTTLFCSRVSLDFGNATTQPLSVPFVYIFIREPWVTCKHP